MDRDAEVKRLNLADTHIADTETRITTQEVRLDDLRRDEHDTKEAERLLHELQGTLKAMQDHRTLIVDMISKIDAGLI